MTERNRLRETVQMHTLVILLLVLALCVQAVALFLVRSPTVTHQGEGVYEFETYDGRRMWGNVLTVTGLILATVASLLSVLFL